MVDELKKSINSILYERVSSPFYGTFVLSWLIWNWKIVFVTIIENVETLGSSRFKYISENLLADHFILIWYPLLSTIILICIFPFITTGANWLSLKFKKWNTDIKNTIEQNQLLTLKQSVELRLEIKNHEDKIEKLLADKNKEIENLNLMIDSLKNQLSNLKNNSLPENVKDSNFESINRDVILSNEYVKLKENKYLYNSLGSILRSINIDEELGRNVDAKAISYYSSHGIIEKTTKPGIFKLTNKGLLFERIFSEEQVNNEN